MKKLLLATSCFAGLAAAAFAQPVTGPLASIGQAANSVGLYPNLVFVQLATANPDMGQQTGNSEFVSIINMGADADLQKMLGLNGSSIHFQEFLVPEDSDLAYGGQAGDVIAGNPGPFIPWIAHLQRFTLEQTFLNGSLFVEGGKSNAGDYFAQAACDQPFGCLSTTTMIQQNAGFAPPPYANWSARGGYHFSPALTAQIGTWNYDVAFPFSNGWTPSHLGAPSGHVYLADLSYKTDPHAALYPSAYEAMFYRNTLTQHDPLTGKATDGDEGIYLSGKQTFWRASPSPLSTSLSAFATDVTELNANTGNGLKNTVDAGLSVQGLFPSRPFDTYGVKATWVQLTSDEQKFLQNTQTAINGSYAPGAGEYGVGVDATFVISPSLIFQPFATYVIDDNAWGNPTSTHKPQDGVNVGGTFVVVLGQMLGLGTRYNYP